MEGEPNHSKINQPKGRFENSTFLAAVDRDASVDELFLIAKPVAGFTCAYHMRGRGDRENGFNLHLDDCIQEAEIAIWHAINDGKWVPERGDPFSFFFKLSRNAALDYLRSKEIRNMQPIDPAGMPYITGADGQVPVSVAAYTDLVAAAHGVAAASRNLAGDSMLAVASRWVVQAVVDTHAHPDDPQILEALEGGFHLDAKEARQVIDSATITLRTEFKRDAPIVPDVTAIQSWFMGTPLAALLAAVPSKAASAILAVCAGTNIEFPDYKTLRRIKRMRAISMAVQEFTDAKDAAKIASPGMDTLNAEKAVEKARAKIKRTGATMKQAMEIHKRYALAVKAERQSR